MSLVRILGTGVVTPLDPTVSGFAASIREEKRAPETLVRHPGRNIEYPVHAVDRSSTPETARLPRLRRSSPISHYAVAAALRALQSAALNPEDLPAETALVFASSNGSVVYTRKFFDGLLQSSTGSGSPLLFPETVYNAPASHVAATLGVVGETITMVSDATAACSALKTAIELIDSGAVAKVLVVAAEELDPIICEGYQTWRLINPGGVRFSEGAAAVLLGHGQGPSIEILDLSMTHTRKNALQTIEQALTGLPEPDLAVVSSCGNYREEETLFAQRFPSTRILSPRRWAGDALAAASLWQVALAADAWQKDPKVSSLVSVLGWNRCSSLLRLGP